MSAWSKIKYVQNSLIYGHIEYKYNVIMITNIVEENEVYQATILQGEDYDEHCWKRCSRWESTLMIKEKYD